MILYPFFLYFFFPSLVTHCWVKASPKSFHESHHHEATAFWTGLDGAVYLLAPIVWHPSCGILDPPNHFSLTAFLPKSMTPVYLYLLKNFVVAIYYNNLRSHINCVASFCWQYHTRQRLQYCKRE
ncbi:unnamed protein product [Chrysodeixis includens]|uniref:Secreted protein n=1 Tax=Chrysodeixis includens TaxID=689277 RepID=A0A9N8KVW7_CHRIL|nr:unnamed protein product [Chrysodeixis includens]